MKRVLRRLFPVLSAFLLTILVLPAACRANDIMGEIQLEGKTHIDRTSGVWIDGEYVGYLKELNGSKKVLLLPGKHTVLVRQAGYKDFAREVTLQPGEVRPIDVAMQRDYTEPKPRVTSEVKISANPSRAAVFVDDMFIGHVGEFNGFGRALLVAPGAHRIRIALPGYESFEADINPRPEQKVEIKTDLLKSRQPLADPLLSTAGSNAESPAAAGETETTPGAMASPQKK
jgi:hypothetical protein